MPWFNHILLCTLHDTHQIKFCPTAGPIALYSAVHCIVLIRQSNFTQKWIESVGLILTIKAFQLCFGDRKWFYLMYTEFGRVRHESEFMFIIIFVCIQNMCICHGMLLKFPQSGNVCAPKMNVHNTFQINDWDKKKTRLALSVVWWKSNPKMLTFLMRMRI